MNNKNTLNIFRIYFEKQIRFAQKSLTKPEKSHQPFITLSRQTGAGGINFSEKLVQVLNEKDTDAKENWMLFDKNILEIVLEEHDLPKEISKYMPEKKISNIQDVMEQLFALHPSEHKLVRKISDTLIHLAHLGNAVLVGRGSNLITRYYSNGLHIRLISSLEKRIENIQRCFKLSRTGAVKLIQKEEKDRSSYIKKYFNKDINDPSLYGLIINFDIFKIPDALDLISDEVIKIRNRIKI